MKAQYDVMPNETEEVQGKKVYRFNMKSVSKIDEMTNNEITTYECDEVKVDKSASYGDIVEAIIATQYTAGAEIALTNDRDSKPEEYSEYQTFRAMAKELATK
jgi:hypothetical protein